MASCSGSDAGRSRSRSRTVDRNIRRAQTLAALVGPDASGYGHGQLPGGFDSVAWWSKPLYQSLEHVLHSLGQARPLTLDSACSGLCTEAMVCDVMGIKVGSVRACDPKASARQFMEVNLPERMPKVIYEDMANMAIFCDVDEGCEPPDMFIAGPPCQPFSEFRPRSGETARTGKPEQHPAFDVTMKELPSLMESRRPKLAIIEQVIGLDASYRLGSPDSFMTELVDKLATIFDAVRVLELNSDVWITMSRPRLSGLVQTSSVAIISLSAHRFRVPLCIGTLFV